MAHVSITVFPVKCRACAKTELLCIRFGYGYFVVSERFAERAFGRFKAECPDETGRHAAFVEHDFVAASLVRIEIGLFLYAPAASSAFYARKTRDYVFPKRACRICHVFAFVIPVRQCQYVYAFGVLYLPVVSQIVHNLHKYEIHGGKGHGHSDNVKD